MQSRTKPTTIPLSPFVQRDKERERERAKGKISSERASLINLRPEASPRNKTFSHGGTSIHEHENLRTRKKRVNVLPAASLSVEREREREDYLGAFLERPPVTHEPRNATTRSLPSLNCCAPFRDTAKQDETLR